MIPLPTSATRRLARAGAVAQRMKRGSSALPRATARHARSALRARCASVPRPRPRAPARRRRARRAAAARKRGVATDGGSFTRSRAPKTPAARRVTPRAAREPRQAGGKASLTTGERLRLRAPRLGAVAIEAIAGEEEALATVGTASGRAPSPPTRRHAPRAVPLGLAAGRAPRRRQDAAAPSSPRPIRSRRSSARRGRPGHPRGGPGTRRHGRVARVRWRASGPRAWSPPDRALGDRHHQEIGLRRQGAATNRTRSAERSARQNVFFAR